jgi:hypothetical protein
MATKKTELKRIKFDLPSKLGGRKAFTSEGPAFDGDILDLPVEEAATFVQSKLAAPFDADLEAADDAG